jgi:hypothetical protein
LHFTNSVWGFLFPHILTCICFVCVINDYHSDWSEVESQCCFDLRFLYGKNFLPFCRCLFSLVTPLLCRRFFSFMQFHLLILSLNCPYWSSIHTVITYAYVVQCVPYSFLE